MSTPDHGVLGRGHRRDGHRPNVWQQPWRQELGALRRDRAVVIVPGIEAFRALPVRQSRSCPRLRTSGHAGQALPGLSADRRAGQPLRTLL